MPDPPTHVSKWMWENEKWLQELPIGDFLWLPGSHDAGMSSLTSHTEHSTIENTITQKLDIKGQLELGIRWFDIRPMRKDDGTWWCGHFGHTGVGWQGGTGQPMRDVMNQACEFVKQNSEFVVLRLTHLHEVSTGKQIQDHTVQEELLDFVFSFDEVYKHNQESENCLQQVMSRYIHKVLITTLPSDGQGIDHEPKIWKKSGRADWDINGGKQIVGLNLQQSDIDAIITSGAVGEYGSAVTALSRIVPIPIIGPAITWVSSLITAASFVVKGSSIQDSAKPFQALELPFTPQRIASCPATGVVIADFIDDAYLLTFSLAATRARYLAKKFENSPDLANQLAVVYGGKLITDQKVLDSIQSSLNNNEDFQVTNDRLGGDPWPGVGKFCVVCYKFEKRGSDMFYRARSASEGGKLAFNIDIEKIQWQDHVLEGHQFTIGYSNIFRALLLGGSYKPNPQHFDNDDPAPGKEKTLRMTYRSGDHSKTVLKRRRCMEYGEEPLGLDIDFIIWDSTDDPAVGKTISAEGYESFFWSLAHNNGLNVEQVWNKLFSPEQSDPAPGQHKKARMRWRRKIHDKWEDSTTEEGWKWLLEA